MTTPKVGDTIVFRSEGQGGKLGFVNGIDFSLSKPFNIGQVIWYGDKSWMYYSNIDWQSVDRVLLTIEQKKKIVLVNDNQCPVCLLEDNIEGGHMESDSNYAFRKTTCGYCNSSWNELFTLTDIEDIEVNNG